MRCPDRAVSRTKMGWIARRIVATALLVLALQVLAFYAGVYEIQASASLKRATADPNAAPLLRHLTHLAGRFVQFSAYRQSRSSFYVIGLYSRLPRVPGHPVYSCQWRPANASHALLPPSTWRNTSAVARYIKTDEHRVPYAVVVVNCEFEEEDVAGEGLLYLILPTFTRALSRLGRLGWKQWRVETVLAMRAEAMAEKSARRTWKYAFCGPPIAAGKKQHIREDWLMHWLTYHLYVMEGEAHFFFYNVGGLSERGRRMIAPLVELGFVSITDVLNEGLYPAWYHGQVLYINDCLHRSRFVADWTLFFDFDELLYFQPPLTLGALVEQKRNSTFMSLGSWPVATNICSQEEGGGFYDHWPLQRMLYKKQPGPECKCKRWASLILSSNTSMWLCPRSWGRRKFLLNPSKVFAAGVHSMVDPEQEEEVLDARWARVDHYRGMLSPSTPACTITRNDSITSAEDPSFFARYLRDDTIPLRVAQARQFLLSLLQHDKAF